MWLWYNLSWGESLNLKKKCIDLIEAMGRLWETVLSKVIDMVQTSLIVGGHHSLSLGCLSI